MARRALAGQAGFKQWHHLCRTGRRLDAAGALTRLCPLLHKLAGAVSHWLMASTVKPLSLRCDGKHGWVVPSTSMLSRFVQWGTDMARVCGNDLWVSSYDYQGTVSTSSNLFDFDFWLWFWIYREAWRHSMVNDKHYTQDLKQDAAAKELHLKCLDSSSTNSTRQNKKENKLMQTFSRWT